MFIVRPPKLVRRILHNFVWALDQNEKVIYLTFDDGPTPTTTPIILDVLDKFNAKATFFCVGDNVRKFPEWYNELLKRGHKTGNHTFNHLNGWKTNNYAYYFNTLRASTFIKSSLFRPPYGKITIRQKQMVLKKFHIIMWDILTRDYDKKVSAEECLHYVLDFARSGSIVVFHDSLKSIEKVKIVLPQVLQKLSDAGYRFEAIKDF